MKNKKIILIAIMCLTVIGVIFGGFLFIVNSIKKYKDSSQDYNYTVENILNSNENEDDNSIVVSKTENTSIIKPYLSENVKISKYYYDYTSNNEKQENSIIYYQNTYMQNNGVDYSSEDSFDVISVLDGEVVSIEDSELYGKVLTIKNSDSLTTVYSNVENVLVSVGYKVSQGEIIGNTKLDTITNNNNYLLHFEVYYKGDSMDPEKLYTMTVSDIQ